MKKQEKRMYRMALSPRMIRLQLKKISPRFASLSLETLRKNQNRVGELMEVRFRREVIVKDHDFDRFSGAWIVPKDERRQGVILYLHGGGYTCGGLDYAKGFGSTLAAQCGVRVFCAAYRLAPEHPAPAALEDALTAYRYLLKKGYSPEHIAFCGESAGGGLCYGLCLKLRELEIPVPACVVTVSPWIDLTNSGESYETNKDNDPSIIKEILDYFSSVYTKFAEDPFVSPLFGDLTGMPPSLIFVGGDEILLSDSQRLHGKLLGGGCHSQLVIRPERWHGYLLYCLKEDREDFVSLNRFLNDHFCQENKLRWMKLDNAAKIYPASRNDNWSNVFRVSATLTETVDVEVLQSALDVTVRRFPSIAARLRRGVFWYYIQQLEKVPKVREESSYPLTNMPKAEIRQCALRCIVYRDRVALEIFHSLTDGNGALIFLKTLLAEYLQQKYGIRVPAQDGILGRLEEPSEEELEDSFQKYAGNRHASRKATDAWKPKGTKDPDDFKHLTCLQVPVGQVRELARKYGVSITAFLTAAMMKALQNLQKEEVPNIRHRLPIKIFVPVNLRKIFPSKSLRNFVLYTIPEIDPRMGEYTFPEICSQVVHRMGLEVNAKHMSSMIATNISSERMMLVRVMPLFIKNLVMKLVFLAVGERKSCLTISNLGQVQVPKEMADYVKRFDFILSIQATSPYNCGVLSYGDTLYINIIRNILEPELEYHLYCVLRDMGLPVTVESNRAMR